MVRLSGPVLGMEIAERGAEIVSIREAASGREWIWNRDPKYWAYSASILFPFIGRLQDARYSTGGNTYPMGLHGFIRDRDFFVQSQSGSSVLFAYESTDSDYEAYPYRFTFFVEYTLAGNAIEVRFTISSRDSREMPCALGFHPAFMIPEPFEAHRAVFPQSDMQIGVFTSDTRLWTGRTAPYHAECGSIPLSHGLFDDDALILSEYGGAMSIADGEGRDIIRVISPDFPRFGLWQKPKSDAPFVCLEPWSSYPGLGGVLDDIDRRSDFLHIPAGGERMLMVRIEFPEA